MAGCATCDNYNYVRCRDCSWNDAMNIVEEMSEVEAAPVVYGRWRTTRIETIYKVRKTIGALEFCTACGKPMENISKYCHNCGAKMIGVIKGETDKS